MQMKIQMEEAGDRFNELLEQALKGTEVLIIDKKKAVARLVRIEADRAHKDKDKWTTDDFNIQLSKDK
jgi:antitoxin (DNA-binding transcriptional repressor) of toxin-antitoxin stability system